MKVGAKFSSRWSLVLLLFAIAASLAAYVGLNSQRDARAPSSESAKRVADGRVTGASHSDSAIGQTTILTEESRTKLVSVAYVKAATTTFSRNTSAALQGVKQFEFLYASLRDLPSDQLTNDDLSVLRYIHGQCAAVKSEASSLRANVLDRKPAVSGDRIAAAKLLLDSCKNVKTDDDELTRLIQESVRRQHEGSANFAIAYSSQNGGPEQSGQLLRDSLTRVDALSMYQLLSSVSGPTQQQGDAVATASHASGVNTDLSEAWTLTVCGLASTCGEESPDVLWRCAISNQCGAKSPEDALQKFEPDRFRAVDQLRRDMSRSIADHDWTWLVSVGRKK